ncbi:MAG: carbon-nitrogen hydrolase family protein, partial [Candidatus Poribacteria bacterium]
DANLTTISDMANEAADAAADLVVFPEAALTGLINNDEPTHDLPFGQPIPGPVTDVLAKLSRERRIWLAIGLLEREGDRLYDSAVLFTPDGEISLKHRRIQPQWHGRNADPSVYCQGAELPKTETPLGSFAFLICGELFDDELIQRVRDLRPDWLLFPFARCFDEDCQCEQRWNREEKAEYAKRVKLAEVTTLMTNYLSEIDGCFGGAMVVSGDGTVVDSFPPGKVGILMVDL